MKPVGRPSYSLNQKRQVFKDRRTRRERSRGDAERKAVERAKED